MPETVVKGTAERLSHLEAEVGGLRSDFAELKSTIGRLFERIENTASANRPSWQAIFAFVFSAISALVLIGGILASGVALFVRSETNTITAGMTALSKAVDHNLAAVEQLDEAKIEVREHLKSVDSALTRLGADDKSPQIFQIPNH